MNIRKVLGALGLFLLTGCATTPNDPGIPTALVIWPSTAGCDFDQPDRERSWAISTNFDKPSLSPTRGARASYIYSVRDAQGRGRIPPDQPYCLSVRRGPVFGEATSVFGFELTALDAARLRLTPRYAAVKTPAGSLGGGRPMAVSVAFGGAPFDAPEAASIVNFDLGDIPTDGTPTALDISSEILIWHESDTDLDILRLGAVVRESRPGAVSGPISRDQVLQTMAGSRP